MPESTNNVPYNGFGATDMNNMKNIFHTRIERNMSTRMHSIRLHSTMLFFGFQLSALDFSGLATGLLLVDMSHLHKHIFKIYGNYLETFQMNYLWIYGARSVRDRIALNNSLDMMSLFFGCHSMLSIFDGRWQGDRDAATAVGNRADINHTLLLVFNIFVHLFYFYSLIQYV